MKTVTLKLYDYGELSEKAKEKARNWYSSTFLEGDISEMLEYTLHDAQRVASFLGLMIPTCCLERGRGTVPIYYDGLEARDGLWFKGAYAYREAAVAQILAEYPQEHELQRIACELQKLAAMYDCDATFDIDGQGNQLHVETSTDYDLADETMTQYVEAITDLMKDFATWIHERLRGEWEYQTSDTTIAECCAVNEYTFLEGGKPWLES